VAGDGRPVAERSRPGGGGSGHSTRAFRLAAASAQLRAGTSVIISPIEQAELDAALAAARQTVGESKILAASNEGRAMTLDEAVSYAIEDDSA